MYVLVFSVQILHLVCSSFSPHGCRVGAGSDVQASEGLLRDPRAVPEHPIPPGSISVLPTPLPSLQTSPQPAAPPVISREGVNWGAEGIQRAETARRDLKPSGNRQRSA